MLAKLMDFALEWCRIVSAQEIQVAPVVITSSRMSMCLPSSCEEAATSKIPCTFWARSSLFLRVCVLVLTARITAFSRIAIPVMLAIPCARTALWL